MQKLKKIAGWLQNRGMTLYYVGGYVRDIIMGNTPDDIDICIEGGATAGVVGGYLEILKNAGDIQSLTSVHGDFPIWIVEIEGVKYEFAMARKERKSGQSRQEFLCDVNNVTIDEDLERRDFTINSIAKNVLTGDIIDPFDGRDAIELGVLMPTSEAFKEDSLRVYRGARFCARFGFVPSIRFINYAKSLAPTDISNERVGMELMKCFKQAKEPSMFFEVLKRCGWLGYHFKEVEALIGVPQSPTHHPEGDVYVHTMHCLDAARDWFTRAVMLCHDLGKAIKTQVNGIDWNPELIGTIEEIQKDFPNVPVKITSKGHEEAGVSLARSLLKRIHFCDHKTIHKIGCLVELHMIRTTLDMYNFDKIIRRTVRKLMQYELDYSNLCKVVYCDLAGRPPKRAPSEQEVFMELYAEYAIHLVSTGEMTPIVTGEKLQAYGLKPGPEFGVIMTKALELQDRGTLDATNWVERLRGAGFEQFKNKKE